MAKSDDNKAKSPSNPSNQLVKTKPGFDDRHRFAKGNKLSSGNPYFNKIAAMRTAMFAAVSKQDWTDITNKAVDQAKAGDKAARDWLSNYIVGKPVQVVDANVISHVLTPDEVKIQIDKMFDIEPIEPEDDDVENA